MLKSITCFFICFVIIFKAIASDSIPTSDSSRRPLYPHLVHLQYAGNMGFLSIGFSYELAKSKLTLGLLGGYLPQSIGGTRLGTATIKFGYHPWKFLKTWKDRDIEITPFTVGVNFIKTWGENIESTWPSYYPRGYYPWNPSMNYAIYFGSSLEYILSERKRFLKGVGLFYEVGLTSRLAELWWENQKTVGFIEIWNLSLGLNLQLR